MTSVHTLGWGIEVSPVRGEVHASHIPLSVICHGIVPIYTGRGVRSPLMVRPVSREVRELPRTRSVRRAQLSFPPARHRPSTPVSEDLPARRHAGLGIADRPLQLQLHSDYLFQP